MQTQSCAFRLLLVSAVLLCVPAAAQTPAYLTEMPSVERVKREIQGSDAQDTALRQAGAFWQLQEIIRTLAGLRDPDQLTADERKLKQAYYEAAFYVSQAIENTLPTEDEKRKWRNRSPYRFARTDPRFGVQDLELFKRFFSPSFRGAFDKANGVEGARQAAFAKSQVDAQQAARAQEKAAQAGMASQGQSEREVARCLASGRPELQCVADVFGKGLKDIAGVVNPSLNVEVPAGLRLNGLYTGQGGLSLGFHSLFVSVECDSARRDDLYTLELRGPQILVTVQNEPKPYTLTLTAEGRLSGSGTISVRGKVRTGTRHFTDGTSAPLYDVQTRSCTPGVMPMNGQAPAIEVNEVLNSLGASSKEGPAPLGLRMNGTYAGPSGFNIEFHSVSAVLGCREVAIAQPYMVERRGGQIQVTIQSPIPTALKLGAEGTLTGSGPIQLNGRVVTGVTGNASRPVAYQARSTSCNLGVLSPTKAPQGEAAAGAAAARQRQ